METIRSSEWLLFMAMLIHLIMAPFTKVEESFNVQAIHDLLYKQMNVSDYDHHTFPGVVPRTFSGALAISSMLAPFLPFMNWMGVQKYWVLFTARLALGSAVLLAFCNFCRCIEKRFGFNGGTFLRLITSTQFHFLFYASRPLPNTFALILVLVAIQRLLDRHFSEAVVLSTIATFVFRFELVLLFGPLFIVVFARRQYSPWKAVGVGAATFLLTLAVTVPLDSFLWGRWPLWAEGEVIWFNTVLNRSQQYGVSPFHWYFTSALPRALGVSLLLVPLGFVFERNGLWPVVGPAISFIITYSFLPHKELRFIIYAFPLLSLSAAVFCARV